MAKEFLTYTSALVLQAIVEGHRYGFDIMDATGLPSGTVYPALRRFERVGLVESSWEAPADALRDARPARRYYEVTGAGADALEVARRRFVRLAPAPLAPAPGH